MGHYRRPVSVGRGEHTVRSVPPGCLVTLPADLRLELCRAFRALEVAQRVELTPEGDQGHQEDNEGYECEERGEQQSKHGRECSIWGDGAPPIHHTAPLPD